MACAQSSNTSWHLATKRLSGRFSAAGCPTSREMRYKIVELVLRRSCLAPGLLPAQDDPCSRAEEVDQLAERGGSCPVPGRGTWTGGF
jgi:hypothetical protein